MHPATENLLKWLTPNPNLPAQAYIVAQRHHELAVNMVSNLPEGPELSAGLRKLLEAKDCLVRAAL